MAARASSIFAKNQHLAVVRAVASKHHKHTHIPLNFKKGCPPRARKILCFLLIRGFAVGEPPMAMAIDSDDNSKL